jgi:restriction system protein
VERETREALEHNYLEGTRRLDGLRAMDPIEFQSFMWIVYRRLGYSVQPTPASRDGGADGFLEKDGKRFVLQCKRYRGQVGEDTVRDILGTIVHNNAVGGFVVTTGTFSSPAVAFCSGKQIQLVNGEELLKLIVESGLSAADTADLARRRPGSALL